MQYTACNVQTQTQSTVHVYTYVCYVVYSLGADSSSFSAVALSINL